MVLHRMMAMVGALNPITVNGRTYSHGANSFVDVPEHDSFLLEANGWTKVANSSGVGTTAQRPVNPRQGQTYTDTTLSKIVHFEGKTWRDPVTGATA
jgi:hypothetical protein